MSKPIKIGKATGPTGGTYMMPPPPDACQECAHKHEPSQPHNAQTMFYQYKFANKHGRWPTWADAIAHCAPQTQEVWKKALMERGAWTEPVQENLTKEERAGRIIGGMPTERVTMEPGNIAPTTVHKIKTKKRRKK